MIFDENVEGEDFLELALSDEQYEMLKEIGVVMDFPEGLIGKRNLNVFIRMEGESMPLVKGPKAKSKEGFSENVRREMEAGKPQKQAVAIAYSESRDGKKKVAKKGKK
jgi:hypothetical protein